MDVILHLGAHRTATTHFQHMMGHNGTDLARRGLAYWGPKRTRTGLFHGLYGSSEAVLPWQKDRAKKRIRLRARQHDQDGMRQLVVSEENMLGPLRAVVEGPTLYPGAGAHVARFAEGFGDHPLTLGLGIRCYDAWWASVLAFRLPRGGPLPKPALLERMITQPRRWRHVIADVARAAPQARLLVWTHEARADDPVALLRAVTGRRQLKLRPWDRRIANPAPTPEALSDYLDACNADARLIRNAQGRFMPFDAHQREVLRAQYADDLTWLAAGAEGLATYIDDAPEQGIETGQKRGRGRRDEGPYNRRPNRELA